MRLLMSGVSSELNCRPFTISDTEAVMTRARIQDRCNRVLEYINTHEYVSFSELCRFFDVSSATMRRDLVNLADRGLITRFHGAVKSKLSEQAYEPPYSERVNYEPEEKRKIAQRALREIHDGDSIILDSSTTILELARVLAKDSPEITVMTNDVEIACILAPNPNIDLICVGGHIRQGYYTSIGLFAENLWKNLHADKLFLGVDAVSARFGMMNYRIEELSCKKLMLNCSSVHYILCDHTKFTSSAVLQICPIDEVDMVITGRRPPSHIEQELKAAGLHIEIA